MPEQTQPFPRARPVPTKVTRERSRSLRNNQTKPEWILWLMLRGGQMGVKFRRQQPIDHYIVDFYCPDLRLVIEVDGGQHTVDVDAVRTAYLRAQGLQILRFWNNDILNNQPGVYLTIVETIRSLQAAKGTPSVSASPFRLCRATSPVKGEDKPI